jgi:hypothetical protein
VLPDHVYVPPVVLVAVGVHSLAKQSLSAPDVGWLAVTVLLGVAFGAVRAATTVLYARNGVLWQRYTAKTLVVLLRSRVAGVPLSTDKR